MADAPQGDPRIDLMLATLQAPFWAHLEFWISTILGLLGLGFSIAAFVEARRAKISATEAGRVVRVQTVAIELSEISQRLEKIQPKILFSEARDLLQDISRRLHRALSPYASDTELKSHIESTFASLVAAQSALKSVRPTDPDREAEAQGTVYYVIEDQFAQIANAVADVLGLLERKAG